ncbi:MAG: PEP-CTERM sorting domain-containing protein [candidate division Zixibacteria bacterium]|nr:PEP-CTERM sorting domain-containing protein [candidate division Zixibacteria bacterium]
MERILAIAKLTAIAMAIVVAILCLGYSNAYGLSAPQMQLTKPGEQSLMSQSLADAVASSQFDINVEVGSDFNDDDGTLGDDNERTTVPEPMTLILLGFGLAGIKRLKRLS